MLVSPVPMDINRTRTTNADLVSSDEGVEWLGNEKGGGHAAKKSFSFLSVSVQ